MDAKHKHCKSYAFLKRKHISLGVVKSPILFPVSPLSAHLYFFDGVDDKGILQVLHGALHPVVERSRSFGKLKVQLVNGFKQLLSSLWSIKKKNKVNTQTHRLFLKGPSKSCWVKLKNSQKLHFIHDLPESRGTEMDLGGLYRIFTNKKNLKSPNLKGFSRPAGILEIKSLHSPSL